MTSFQQSTAPKASKFLTRCIPEMNSPWAQPHAALMDPSAGSWGTSGSHSHTPSSNAALRPAPEPEGSPQEPRGKVETVQKSHRSGVRLWAAAQPCSTVSPVPVPPAPSTGPAHRPGLRPEGRVQRRRFSSQAFPCVAAAAFLVSPLDIMALGGNINNSTTTRRHTIRKGLPQRCSTALKSLSSRSLSLLRWTCSYCTAYRHVSAFCGNYTLS